MSCEVSSMDASVLPLQGMRNDSTEVHSAQKAQDNSIYFVLLLFLCPLLYPTIIIFEFIIYPIFLYIFSVIKRSVSYGNLAYEIEGDITSPATRVIFTRSMRTNERICLKIWLPCENGVYNTNDINKCIDFLVEGLEFNRRFAGDVLLGIAQVELKQDSVLRGRLIEKPDRDKLRPGELYALVMKRLSDDWRLDRQLCNGELGTPEGIEFLAKEVARMHEQMLDSKEYKVMGKPESISEKLKVNIKLFHEALYQLACDPKQSSNHVDVKKYKRISNRMKQACKAYAKYFDHRYQNDHIKRCHGDLKAANLWVRPVKPLFSRARHYELLALDCVDFNPQFCYIDTLSDVAMLASDIEMRLTNWLDKNVDGPCGEELTKHFLDTYLEETHEDGEEVEPLLEYYMTEKAMICAYMSILYDGLPSLGEKYLDVALNHSYKLEKLLELSSRLHPRKLHSSKKKTIPLPNINPGETTPGDLVSTARRSGFR